MKIELAFIVLGITALLAIALNQVQVTFSTALTVCISLSFTLKVNIKLRKQAGLLFCN